jgi:UDP-glucose 4-epimerase
VTPETSAKSGAAPADDSPERSEAPQDPGGFYRGRRILVTGGLGFIGSNLCLALVGLGARVTAVDSLLPECGGNRFNLAGHEDEVDVRIADLRDPGLDDVVRGQEVIFNLAGQVSHVDSMSAPLSDLEINSRSQLCLLEAVRQANPEARVVYAGTRQVYGKPLYLPVDEKHPLQPSDVNGIHKISAEMYHLVYHTAHGLRASSLRLTNTYGERQLIRHNRQGFIGWFVGQAVRGEEIKVFGDGAQKRDFNHVSDVVDAFLRVGATEAADGRVFNLGSSPAVSLLELANLLVELTGKGSVRVVPFPEDRKRIDIGDFYADTSLVRKTLGWEPRVPLREGLERTLDFYRRHHEHYA